MNRSLLASSILAAMTLPALSTEFHVSPTGKDHQPGTAEAPLQTIRRAADLAQPGDTITVHAGIYRERVNPPRGGESDSKRITYQAAPGEKVEIRGSEVIKDWERVEGDVWKVTLPNSFFGSFNPYSDLLYGDWCDTKKRRHHTGAVYLNGEWLVEAATVGEVLNPSQQLKNQEFLLNLAWVHPVGGGRVQAAGFSAQNGVQKAESSEGGECIGYLSHGDWVTYDTVDFGSGCEQVELRVASAAPRGGMIELRQGDPTGELLGTCQVPGTGEWQNWKSITAKIKRLSGKQKLSLRFANPPRPGARDDLKWFGLVNTDTTTLWAQFPGVNPNEQTVEINVRRTVFYPEKTGINYLTVRGFGLRHAATPWAPPTAEQVGLIGTNWSKGWIIENNDVSHSVCTGITLGKHGDEWDNQSADTAEGYVKTIERAAAKYGWSKENIGHHIVRNNRVSHCEMSGVVGSLGAVFSTITGNTIHDIHVRRLFGGAEMAGLKFHGALDFEISDNHIHHTCLAIWLDWMAQGVRVTRNLMHDNGNDLFTEVNHGPILVDNNLLLSGHNLASNSQGAAYVHNLFAGPVVQNHHDRRLTPYLKPHSTEVAQLHDNPPGDHQFYNNVFIQRADMSTFERAVLPMKAEGNVFFKGAKPCKHENNPLKVDSEAPFRLLETEGAVVLELTLPEDWEGKSKRPIVTTELLGKTAVSQLPYVQPDGKPFRIDTDFFGKKRSVPTPGPFEAAGHGTLRFEVRKTR